MTAKSLGWLNHKTYDEKNEATQYFSREDAKKEKVENRDSER
jgi:hypothetical protein